MCGCSRRPTPICTPSARPDDFREDLLFRLNTVEIHLPPLRERREDIPALAAALPQAATPTRYRQQIQGLDPGALQAHDAVRWPGNVRELDHTIERAVLMARSQHIEASDLGLRHQTQRLQPEAGRDEYGGSGEHSHPQSLARVTTATSARQQRRSGLSRGALYRRMEKYGI